MLEKMRQQKLLSPVLVLATLSVGILIGTLVNSRFGAARAQSGVTDAKPLTVPPVTRIGNEFSDLAQRVEASVVNISVESVAEAPEPEADPDSEEGELPDLFRRFFPDGGAPEPRTRSGAGTGFVVDSNGYILTNNHVVENATKIRVRLHNDPTEYRARVIGTDYETDLAVIKIDTRRPLAPVQIANSESVQVGDWAVAIGSPFGLEATVTAGIVSATGRGVDEVGPQARRFQSFIQTDAAINPGNSGGPLLNIRGEVIGVNTMIATTRGGSEGVGFALPVNTAVRVYNDIIRDGRVTRGSIGVTLMDVQNHAVAMKALGVGSGAIVQEVRSGGPAAEAGLQTEDIITGINGEAVRDNEDLISRVADLPVGRPATLNVDRDGKKVDLKVIIADRLEMYKDQPEIVGRNRAVQEQVEAIRSTGEVQFGIRLRGQLTPEEKELAKGGRGVAIASVVEGSFADETGLEADDIILTINRKTVSSAEEIKKIQQTLKPGDPVVFQLVRRLRGFGKRAATQTASMYLAGSLPEN